MTADAPNPSRPEHLAEERHAQEFFQRRRKVSLIAMPCGALACFAGYHFAESASDFSWVDAWGLPILGSYLTAASVLLWRRPGSLFRIEQVGFVLLALYLLAALAHQVLIAPQGGVLLGPRSYWLFFTYLLAFIIWAPYTAVYICVGIIAVLIGILTGAVLDMTPLKPATLSALTQLLFASIAYVAAHFGFAQLRTHYAHMRALAFTDELTGCANRRRGTDLLTREFARARRYRRHLSIILFDLDHFKRINDEHGHAAGDKALRAVARSVQQVLRQPDHLVRWGGEEFLIVSPELSLDEAAHLAERLRQAIRRLRLAGGHRPSASFGIAACEYHKADTVDTLLKRADTAMYTAKKNGRDRIELATRRDIAAPATGTGE